MGYFLAYMVFLAFPPLLINSFVFMKRDTKRWRQYIVLYALLIGLFAYSYVPVSGDLSRYIGRLYRYFPYSLKEAFSVYYWLDVGEVFWDWLIARTDAPGLLSAVPQFIIYFIASYITCDYLERRNVPELIYKAFILQFFLVPQISTINNIYCVTAFSLVVLAIYRDLVQNKRNIATYALYILPCFIHNSAVILIILRVLAMLIKKARYISVAIAFLIPVLLTVLYNNIGFFRNNQLLYRVIVSGYRYYSEEGTAAYSVSRLYFLSFIHNMLFSFLSAFLILKFQNRKEDNNLDRITELKENTFLSFLLLVSVVAISCVIFNAPHYWRFNFVVKLCVAGLLLLINDNPKIKKTCFYLLLIDGLLVKFTETVDLLRIANLSQTLVNFLLSSPFGIVFKLIINMF